MSATVYHPAFGQALRYRVDVVSDDPQEQVSQTINMMAEYVVEDWNSPEIEADALQALMENPTVSPIEAVFRFVKKRVVFTSDQQLAAPLQTLYQQPIVETLIRPRDLSVLCSSVQCQRQGDCDDFTMYTAALLHAIGIQDVRFVTVKADGRAPDEFSHVYVVAYHNQERIPLDTSHGYVSGWETPQVFGERKEWPIGASGFLLPLLVLALLIGVCLWQ
jgi:hypothetical protein